MRAQAWSDMLAAEGGLSLPYDLPFFLFSSSSPLLAVVSSQFDLSSARRWSKGFRSGWEGALLSLYAEQTAGSLSPSHRSWGWTESNKKNKGPFTSDEINGWPFRKEVEETV